MTIIKCPKCKKETEYSGNEFRPFCSERCKLIDFGDWTEGNYSLPAETESLNESDIDQLEKALAQKEVN